MSFAISEDCDWQNTRQPATSIRFCAIQELLEEELSTELLSYGIDPKAERLSDEQYVAAVAELQERQAAVADDSSPQVAARVDQIRRVLCWHLQKVSFQLPVSKIVERLCQFRIQSLQD